MSLRELEVRLLATVTWTKALIMLFCQAKLEEVLENERSMVCVGGGGWGGVGGVISHNPVRLR